MTTGIHPHTGEEVDLEFEAHADHDVSIVYDARWEIAAQLDKYGDWEDDPAASGELIDVDPNKNVFCNTCGGLQLQ